MGPDKTAKELGFVPKYEPLSNKNTEYLVTILMGGPMKEILDTEAPFPIQVLRKRISGLNLPIKFTPKAELIALILTEGNPGKMITLLIDCLTEFQGETIDENSLCENLYPWGFYTYESFVDYIDNYIKPRKVKWSNIY